MKKIFSIPESSVKCHCEEGAARRSNPHHEVRGFPGRDCFVAPSSLLAMTTIALCFLSLTVTASAQAPNDVQDFRSHGIHVILRSTNSNQVVSAVLGIQGGVAYGETDNASISGLTSGVVTESGRSQS